MPKEGELFARETSGGLIPFRAQAKLDGPEKEVRRRKRKPQPSRGLCLAGSAPRSVLFILERKYSRTSRTSLGAFFRLFRRCSVDYYCYYSRNSTNSNSEKRALTLAFATLSEFFYCKSFVDFSCLCCLLKERRFNLED